jgi:cysteine sulfinate desulfinase/cysteine desulfurase-like protein
MANFKVYDAFEKDDLDIAMIRGADETALLISKLGEAEISHWLFEQTKPETVYILPTANFEKRHFFDGIIGEVSGLETLILNAYGQIDIAELSGINPEQKTLISLDLICRYTGLIISPRDLIDSVSKIENIFLHIDIGTAIDNIDLKLFAGADLVTAKTKLAETFDNIALNQRRVNFEARVSERIADCGVAAQDLVRLPGISCLIIDGVNGEVMTQILKQSGVRAITACACGAPDGEIPPIFAELGYSFIEASNAVTFDLAAFADQNDVGQLIDKIVAVADTARQFSGFKNV